MRQVQPAAARHQQFAASAGHPLDDGHAEARCGGNLGRHQPGGARTDDHNMARLRRDYLARLRRDANVARLPFWIAHQTPVFGIDVHGSAGALASPFWRISIEILSGERMKAMRPSRGGRLIVTPAFIRLAHSA